MNWRRIADWAKRRPATLRLADGLGRGRGRLRVLDRLNPPPAAHKPDLRDWESRELSAVWLGHATVLLRVGGKTILTDPVLSHRIGVGLGVITAGPRRMIAAALRPDELPKLDLILISHAHFDHLDRPTLVKLHKSTPVVTASRTRDLIRDLGFRNIVELQWGDSVRLDNIDLLACEVKHWGARTFQDTYRGYNGYLIEGGAAHSAAGAARRVGVLAHHLHGRQEVGGYTHPTLPADSPSPGAPDFGELSRTGEGWGGGLIASNPAAATDEISSATAGPHPNPPPEYQGRENKEPPRRSPARPRRVLYAGDTAYRRFPDLGSIDLAIFGIAAYDPYIQAHATPEQVWQMFEHLRGRWLLPMHHSTFRLSHEPMHEPIERMLAAAGKEIDRVTVRAIGDEWTAPE